MNKIYTLANIYNETSSRQTRIQAFSSCIRDPLCKRIFLHVFDQQKTVGTVVSMKELEKFSEKQSVIILVDVSEKLEHLLDLLSKCYTRELSGLEARKSLTDACKAGGAYAYLFGKICNKVGPPLISTTTAKKYLPELTSKFSLALCRGSEKSIRYDGSYIIEEKIDGMRVVIFKEDGVTKVYTRNCKELNRENFSLIISDIERSGLGDYALDGEICAKDRFETISLAKTKYNIDQEEKAKMTLYVFDVLTVKELLDRMETKPLNERKKILSQIDRSLEHLKENPWWLANSKEECDQLYKGIIDRGGEGVVLKNFDSPYEHGSSKSWIKIKFENTCDVTVIGWATGNGRLENNLGYIEVDYKGNAVRVNVPADSDRDNLFKMANEGALIGSLVEVLHNGETPYGSLNHPRFLRLRDDKDEVSV